MSISRTCLLYQRHVDSPAWSSVAVQKLQWPQTQKGPTTGRAEASACTSIEIHSRHMSNIILQILDIICLVKPMKVLSHRFVNKSLSGASCKFGVAK